jgi:hypothetical protein
MRNGSAVCDVPVRYDNVFAVMGGALHAQYEYKYVQAIALLGDCGDDQAFHPAVHSARWAARVGLV